jgi:tellurite resistance protein TerC
MFAVAQDVNATSIAWIGLLGLIAAMVLVDLRVGSARGGPMSLRAAGAWSAVWITVSVLFGVGLLVVAGSTAAEGYFAGYVMEKSLSLDNVFVFTLIFAALAVPRDEQARLLLYGILIALVLRGVFIVVGAEALERFSWIAWPFAALLAWTGVRILRANEHDEGAAVVERIRRWMPNASPAVLALGAIALADVLFAVDSVPAILAITTDTYVVFAANAFALLGLRALFFLVSGAVSRFRYLSTGLGILLIAIAGKLAYGEAFGGKVPTSVTLGVIAAVLGASVAASLLHERWDGRKPAPEHEDERATQPV